MARFVYYMVGRTLPLRVLSMNSTALRFTSSARSIDARNALAQANTGLVYFLAKRLHSTLADEADLDELVSAGMLGLMRAAELFDASRKLAFTTFAAARVRGAMLDELRRLDRLPRTLRAKHRELQSIANTLCHQLGRSPNTHEVAAAAGVEVQTLWRWETEMRANAVVTLDANNDEDDHREHPSLGERVAAPDLDLDIELDRDLERERLYEAMESLSSDERLVLALSFFEELTLEEIAPRVGVTESGVSRIRARAIRLLRVTLENRRGETKRAA